MGQNPLMAPQAIPAILQNVKEHMLFWYGTQVHKVASAAAGKDISEFMSIKDATVQTAFDQMLAVAAKLVHSQTQQAFSGVMPVIANAQKLLQQYQQPQPMDPSVVAGHKVQMDAKANADKAEIAKGELALKGQDLQQKATQAAQQAAQTQTKDAQEAELAKAQLAQDSSTTAAQAQVDVHTNAQDNATKMHTTQTQVAGHLQGIDSQNETKLKVTEMDNEVAEEISAAEIKAGHKSNIKNGQAVGKRSGSK